MDEDYINGIMMMFVTMLGFCLPHIFGELIGIPNGDRQKNGAASRQRNKKGVTMQDIARLAECNPGTVSKALNNTSFVHPDTKARILAAVAELNYHPNIITNSIRKGKRHTIGVVVPN
ncbi:MAG: LacI family DNA-binding transcriptional regulator, partial [Synergistaceae bacterium]|nr:LacI family DNA-binding transcriptional regulator [Synergistaceae bacterium]